MFSGEKEKNRSEIQNYIKKVRASKKKQVKLSLQMCCSVLQDPTEKKTQGMIHSFHVNVPALLLLSLRPYVAAQVC